MSSVIDNPAQESAEERVKQLEQELERQTRLNEMLQQQEQHLKEKLEASEAKRRQMKKDTEFAGSVPGKAAKKIWSLWHNARGKAAAASMPEFHRPEKSASARNNGPFTLRASSLKELRVACIMDRFTLESYKPECQLLELTPDNWRAEMDGFDPDMLFIESAWLGKDGLWYRKVAHAGKELYRLTEHCRMKGIPVIYWSKEDPVHFDAFFGAAQMADFIFTTEIDCVRKYKESFGHDNVFLLHFAAQPALHNPLEKYERRDRFCFAGAYYHNFPDRCRVFDEFADVFDSTKGLDIYDRNFGNARPEHAFPERYSDNILGCLDPSEIDVAYKGYNYGVNMNSITQSQTMFARRVFELFASNTIVVGNYSRGVKTLFGDLTISTDDGATLAARLSEHCSDSAVMRRLRLLCLRRVLSGELYEDRLAYIVEKVFGVDLRPKQPEVRIFGFAQNEAEAERMIAAYRCQIYENCRLTLVCPGYSSDAQGVEVISPEDAEKLSLNSLGGWVTVFSPEDYYGANYISDMMLSRRYSDAPVFCKSDYYYNRDNNAVINTTDNTYRCVDSAELRCAVVKSALVEDKSAAALRALTLTGEGFLCVDEFSYCRGWQGEECPAADDIAVADTGIPMRKLQDEAEGIKAENDSTVMLDMAKFSDSLRVNDKRIVCSYGSGRLLVETSLAEGESQFVWCRRSLAVSEFAEDGEVNIVYMGSGSESFRGYCTFYDKDRNRLSTSHAMMNRSLRCPVPEGADYFLLSVKVTGADSFAIAGITIGSGTSMLGGRFVSRSNVMILTNHYPSAEQPYHNMFVHKRVLEYRKDGLLCDVLRIHPSVKPGYREYMGVNIAEGQADLLRDVLTHSDIDTVCVHFLDRAMWEALKPHLDRLRIVIWCHGADIQPWWRRKFNFTEEQLEKQKQLSEERMALWREVFAAMPQHDVTTVFVSQYAADETMEDYGLTPDRVKYRIIHNFIDTELFTYEKKDSAQRNRILTIKSFSNKNYANDLTANAIIELSEKPEFADMEFDIYGRGVLFAEETEQLKRFDNVHLHEQFLTHDEIAALHKTHGVYIASTRCDTQGVSRDEAMSSGLVPIANAVTAIPEFVDDNCGILVPAEDSHGIAEGILRLHNEPEYFERLSAAAAARVRSQTAREHTIEKEIRLIRKVESD